MILHTKYRMPPKHSGIVNCFLKKETKFTSNKFSHRAQAAVRQDVTEDPVAAEDTKNSKHHPVAKTPAETEGLNATITVASSVAPVHSCLTFGLSCVIRTESSLECILTST